MRSRWLYFVLLVLLSQPLTSKCWGKEVLEKFDDGRIHLRYGVDAANRKTGDYIENYPTGKIHIRGNYIADKKSGTWTTYTETGKQNEISSYRNDQLDGPYQWNYPSGQPQMRTTYRAGIILGPVNTFDENGNLIFNLTYPIPWESVQKAWKSFAPTERKSPRMLEEPSDTKPFKAGRMADESQQSALKYVQLYRYLSGVPATNMTIDPQYADAAQHGAVLLAHIGHLEHTPARPEDMDDAFYKAGYAGTSQSDLSEGRDNLFDSINDFMWDSDPSNVKAVGHRQWILMPTMQKTAFGFCGRFSVLYAFDSTRRNDWNWSYIAYPGPGFYPHEMLHDQTAWSVSVNPQRFKIATPEAVSVKISTLDDHYAIVETTAAEMVAIAPCPNGGIFSCIIFIPKNKTHGIGKYVVQVTGLRTNTNAPASLTYLVDVRPMTEKANKPAPSVDNDD
jgi:hypothetical protein